MENPLEVLSTQEDRDKFCENLTHTSEHLREAFEKSIYAEDLDGALTHILKAYKELRALYEVLHEIVAVEALGPMSVETVVETLETMFQSKPSQN